MRPVKPTYYAWKWPRTYGEVYTGGTVPDCKKVTSENYQYHISFLYISIKKSTLYNAKDKLPSAIVLSSIFKKAVPGNTCQIVPSQYESELRNACIHCFISFEFSLCWNISHIFPIRCNYSHYHHDIINTIIVILNTVVLIFFIGLVFALSDNVIMVFLFLRSLFLFFFYCCYYGYTHGYNT